MMEKRRRRKLSDVALRRKAERRLARDSGRSKPRKATGAARTDGAAERLLHELEVHQVELELQNEELRNTRAEVENALARYTEVFDFAPIGYATLTATGTIGSVNHAGARLLGQPRKALVGRRFALFLTPATRNTLATLIDAARASESREEAEVQVDPGPAGARRLRLWATALAGAEPLVLLAIEDITERKAKEERLAGTEADLRDSNRRKDDFLAMLSHELRNPLAPIRNCLYLLRHLEPGSAPAHKAQAIIDHQVAHLTRLVDDLLDVTRINRGKIQLRRDHLRLAELVRETVEAHRGGFEARGLAVEMQLEPGEHWVLGDATRLVQTLSNLLGNAEKFTPRDGKITITLQRRDNEALLEVRDTGIGITSEVARTLFQPFSQAPQTMERATGGLGLGLAMVKGLVELHGGTVSMTSAGLDRGTSIVITLPLAAAPPAEVPAAAPSAPTQLRILVIEDNRDAADSLRDALAFSGHEVEVAYDGPSGIETARQFRPGVVICDIGLPGMNGYEVAAHLRGDQALRDTYLVALTGYARPEDLDRAAAAGFHQHLAKPPTVEKILEVLAAAR